MWLCAKGSDPKHNPRCLRSGQVNPSCLGVAVGVGVMRAAAEGVPAEELMPIVRAVDEIDNRREDEMNRLEDLRGCLAIGG